MKNWQITGFFTILMVGFLLMSGCTNTNPPVVTATPTMTATPGTTMATSTLTVKITPVITVPPEGVYVHIKYLGAWKGTYGMPTDLQAITNSGERYYPVENATGTVQASFEKQDDSVKQTIVVEILKNGRILTSGNSTAGFGKVTLSTNV